MDKLKFLDQPLIYDVNLYQVSPNIIKIKFINCNTPSNVTSGFELINEHNGYVQGKFYDFITIYRTLDDDTIELSNNGTIYIEPEPVVPIITFSSQGGGSLEGDITQQVSKYEDLVIPNTVPDENYKFVKWNPEIPTTGNIISNQTFYAEFEYVPTEEELAELFKQKKIEKISFSKSELAKFLETHPITSTAHNNEEGIYSVTSEKQTLMMSQYMTYQIEKSVNPDAELTWNETGKSCEIWTEEEFLQLILEIKAYVYPLVSYQQSIEEQINICETEEALNNIVIDYYSVLQNLSQS